MLRAKMPLAEATWTSVPFITLGGVTTAGVYIFPFHPPPGGGKKNDSEKKVRKKMKNRKER